MSTKKLAKELGLIRKRTPSSSSLSHTSASNQLFSYLIVIDFESTCWREKNNHGQEIIEFPAVLMNTHTGQIESEFHSYVQPQEHPVLSSFCTELTGITQEQVEAGLPLHICLSRFTRWLHTLQQERDVVFPRDYTQTHPAVSGKPCAFLTWSDWDLGVCLQYECKRKQISKPEVLNSWIDLRATYRIFYYRKPKGLNGALQDLGIEFSGREHSGLDDARNTARLAWRMIRDGYMMKITKSLSRSGAPVRGVCAEGRVCNKWEEKQPTHTGDTHTGLHAVTSSHTSVCQSLVSLHTVLSSITTPLHTLTVTHASRPDTPLTHGSCLDTPVSDWPEDFVLTEFGESGSYDDVIEDFSENVPHDSASHVCKTKPRPLNSNPPCSNKDPIRSLKGFGTRTTPTIPFSIYNDQSHQSSSSSSSSSSCSVFHAPSSDLSSTVNQSARPAVAVNQSACSSIPINQSKLSSVSVNQSACSYYSINQSHNSISPNQSALSYISVNQSAHSSFSINQTRPSCSVNQSSLSSSSKQLPLPPPRGGLKITAPLCDCGRRSRRLTVCNGGPNHGRAFYTCAGRRSSGPAPRDSTHPGSTNRINGCGFFKWESALIKSSAVSRNTSALGSNLSTAASRNFR
ncbi:ERI1 exoribonuclease 2 isoform X2 [Ictalurus furcatus]|uniref:ERI1 exoribonuclease 2 isoform X2 n=1 Tax=Ictalurus furcatus TaxID=66913 RepID=UPI002350B07B|nr:ERI1 exoribonuclease 2 isoform X2 [Ictalurus furcatus]